MPVTAAVVGNGGVTAVLTALDMAAESRGAAALDRRHYLQLAETDMTGIGFVACRGPGGGHLWTPNIPVTGPRLTGPALAGRQAEPWARKISAISRAGRAMIAVAYAGGLFSDVSGVSRSNGLMTARITLVATCA